MSQTKRLLASFVGLLIGGLLGGAGLYEVFTKLPIVRQSPPLALLSVLVGAGIAVLGGYLGLLAALKVQKSKLARKRSSKQGPQFVPRKQRK